MKIHIQFRPRKLGKLKVRNFQKQNYPVLFSSKNESFSIDFLLVSIKRPGLDIWKKSLLNSQYYLNLNSRSLTRPSLMIESIKYPQGTPSISIPSNDISMTKLSYKYYLG